MGTSPHDSGAFGPDLAESAAGELLEPGLVEDLVAAAAGVVDDAGFTESSEGSDNDFADGAEFFGDL